MDRLYVQTPILESLPLSKELGIPCFLKMEALQPTGSYQARGAGLLIADHVTKGERAFVAAPTSSDAALNLAYACRVLNCELKIIFPPKKLSSLMKEKILQEGAEIKEEGTDFISAEKIGKSFAASQKLPFIDLNHSPLSRDGVSTLIYEIFGAGLKPGAILVYPTPDLLMGISQGFKSCQWADVALLTAETENDCPFATALFAGEKKLENQTVYPHIVKEEEAYEAAYHFANEQRILIEPKMAAPLVLAKKSLPLLKTFSSILIIVSGGADVSLSTFKSFLLK